MSLIEKLTEFEVEKQRYRERDVLDVIDLITAGHRRAGAWRWRAGPGFRML